MMKLFNVFNKKISAIALVAILLLSVLAGCGTTKNQTAGNKKQTIEVWAMGTEGDQLATVKKAFEAKYPNITLNITSIPWANAHDKLVTATAAKKGPDVIELGSSWVTEFAAAGGLLDLGKYNKSSNYPNIKTNNFFSAALDGSKYQGKLYAVPWYVETRVLFYRPDLLAQVGYNQPPKTQAQLMDVAKKLVQHNGKGHYGIDLDLNDSMYPQVFSWQNGLNLIDDKTDKAHFDDPKAFAAVKYYTDFFKEGLAAKPDVQIDITQAFAKGIKPMFISGPWMINIINGAEKANGNFKWAIAPLPKGKVSNTSYLGGAGFGISSYSQHVDADLKFINFMADPANQVKWYKTVNDLPAVPAAWKNPSIANDQKLAVFKKQLANAKPTPMVVASDAISQQVVKAMNDIVVGGADVKTEMKNLQQTAQQLLDKNH
jgi:multiple sugar transport system substrate-binding protein